MLTLLRSLVINELDFCGSVMAGAPDVLLLRLQSVLNAAVRVDFSARKYDHTTPLLRELHWLKVPEGVKFRLCVLTYRCLKVPHPTTFPRPSIQSLAVAPDSVYDLPTRQLYLCHPHAAQLLAIAHFRRLLHEHGTLYRNWFRMRLLFLSFDRN